ncbi:MAG: hypothetical protein ACK50E_03625 [Bacteroidota bacterium]|jgi:hypothetical protein
MILFKNSLDSNHRIRFFNSISLKMNRKIEGMLNEQEYAPKKSSVKKIKGNDIRKNKIAVTDQFIPDDEKIPVKKKDPDDLPEDDPFENPEEEAPSVGEGP